MTKRYERPDGEGCFLIIVDFIVACVVIAALIGFIIGSLIF